MIKKSYKRIKKTLSSPPLTTTLLLLAIIVFLFNLNFEVFWIKAQTGSNVVGEGVPGYLSKWVAGTLTVLSDSATVTVNAESRRPRFIED